MSAFEAMMCQQLANAHLRMHSPHRADGGGLVNRHRSGTGVVKHADVVGENKTGESTACRPSVSKAEGLPVADPYAHSMQWTTPMRVK